MHKITPFLWFDDQAEEAANFYVSIWNKYNIFSLTADIINHLREIRSQT